MSERGVDFLKNTNKADSFALAALDANEDLFVINLCASMTPIHVDSKTLPAGFDHLKLYQVSRMEDGRRRYRLRLGFFTSEAAAEDVLIAVRSRFATAFATCLCNEDLKSASVFLKRPLQEMQHEFDTQRTGRFKISRPIQLPPESPLFEPENTAQPSKSQSFANAKLSLDQQLDALIDQELLSIMQSEQTSQPAPPKHSNGTKAHAGQSQANQPQAKVKTTIDLTASTPPATTSSQRATSNGHFHVGAGVDIPDMGFSLSTDEPAKKAKPESAREAVASFAAKHAVANKAQHPAVKAVATAPAAQSPAPKTAPVAAKAPASQVSAPVPTPASGWRNDTATDGTLPDLEITQTIRPITQLELDDKNGAKWFVVQLAVSDHPVNLDAMPKLDIFDAYTVYCANILENGGIRYALRLGFFSEDVSAQAVMGYLRTFFGSPSVERISKAEHTRFTSPTEKKVVEAPKPEKPAAQASTQPRAQVVSMDAKRAPTPASRPTAIAAKSVAPEIKRAEKPVAKATPHTATQKMTARPAQSTAQTPTRPTFAPMPQASRPIAPSPEVSMPAIKPMVTTRVTGKYAAPTMRRPRMGNTNVPLTNPNTKPRNTSFDATDISGDAALLGLSDSQIMRVKDNPSLLSRLVDKLTR
jgi:hypothetical protein